MTAAIYNLTVDSQTIREDLSDLIDVMTPADAPLHALLDEESTHDTYFDWSIDALEDPTAVATVEENHTPTFSKSAEPARLTAPVCIVERDVEVSDSRRVARTAGMGDPYDYFMWREGIGALKQMELNFHYGKTGTTVLTTELARTCEGVIAWFSEAGNEQTIAGMNFATTRASAPSTGVNEWSPFLYDRNGSLSRTQFHTNILGEGWAQGLNVEGAIILCGSAIKRIISEFCLAYSNATLDRNINALTKQVVETIDFFSSEYGTVGIALDRYMNTATTDTFGLLGSTGVARNQTLLLLEVDKVVRKTYRGLGHVRLSKTGDGTKGMIIYEAGIECRNPLGGVIGTRITG